MSAVSAGPAPAWTVIIPVKDTLVAKSRLSHLDQPARSSLALAFLLDAAAAAVQCLQVRRVVAVTNDAAAGRALAGVGAEVVADKPDRGLNAALNFGVDIVRRNDPQAPVAAMPGDLPALRAEDLTAAFRSAQELPRWFVPDTEGIGTTLLGAAAGCQLEPRFGAESRARHLALGAVEIETAAPARLRRDVDTADHLSAALLLGVGSYTAAALARLDAA